jgi:putative transposase
MDGWSLVAALLCRSSQLSEVHYSSGAMARSHKAGCMARLARVVAVGVPHHVTQRGNARQFILACDADRNIYLGLLRQSIALHGVELIGYCLMSNHVHLIAVPQKADVLGLALKNAHGRYAAYWNASHHSTGHVWQGRYYSCPLDEPHLWEALRYTELNPLRAGMVDTAAGWEWSSAIAHCSGASGDEGLAMEMWQRRWCGRSWRAYLDAGQSESKLSTIRHYTHTGRPLGDAEFVRALERETKRLLALQRRGPKKKAHGEERQGTLSFGA